jgi:hypothetical protein
MKTNGFGLYFLTTLLAGLCACGAVRPAAGQQSLLPAGDAIVSAADPASASSPDDNAYADGVRAINTGQWPDAVAIFTRVATQGGNHAEGALYWKAYAENKQGQANTALETCGTLRHDHPGSSWIEECGALEIEIHAKNGQPVPPKAEQSDDLKLLALASLMQHNEKRALAQIDQILNSDASEKLKQGALFIMGEHHTDTVYPQIARLSFVDGDVRIERGSDESQRKDVTWEEAASGVPLESGYSIVTGNGRAEIELEDASTLYLAPNSVLTINDLSSSAGVPHTDMALLSGTVTLHVHPYVAGEIVLLRTPTDNLLTKYPGGADMRVTSYMDGIAIAGLNKGVLGFGLTSANEMQMPAGQALYFKDGRRILDAGPIHPDDFSGWDAWVAARFASRTAAAEEMAKASGLTAPLPGMADMEGKGRFFDCAPYGTCWEPNPAAQSPGEPATARASSTPEQTDAAEHAGAQAAVAQPATSARKIGFLGTPAASGPPPGWSDMDSSFPCIPDEVRALYFPMAGQFHMQPWAWTVCHSGSWIYQQNQYVWVAGRRHHQPCVHWIKYENTVAFVPIHPHDVKDHLPVNRRAPVFVVMKEGHSIQRAELGDSRQISILREPPRQFRNSFLSPLPRASEPHMEGHQIRETAVARGTAGRPTTIPITFDHHSQSFMMPNHIMEGNRLSTGFAPITNRGGDLQSHSGAFYGGGFHNGYSGYSGGGYRPVSSFGNGGSFHGGGGSGVPSGGASQGGSVSAGAPSSAASSASSAVSGAGASHK